jgi:hypothetical protein
LFLKIQQIFEILDFSLQFGNCVRVASVKLSWLDFKGYMVCSFNKF